MPRPEGKLDKYDLYTRAVQDPAGMADFLAAVYADVNGRPKEVLTLGEDFAGAFALSTEWASRGGRAIVVDNDGTPLAYGKKRLSADVAKRVTLLKRDVRAASLPKADLVASLNFSYGVFQTRKDLATYLKVVRGRLSPGGIVVLDCLGGMELSPQMSTSTEVEDFTYTWEQVDFDPLTRRAKFAIHFGRGGKFLKRAFTYDWRMWTPIELRELLTDVGFKKTYLYWQGVGRSEHVPNNSQSWVAYIVGAK